jgi:hypothetical protein
VSSCKFLLFIISGLFATLMHKIHYDKADFTESLTAKPFDLDFVVLDQNTTTEFAYWLPIFICAIQGQWATRFESRFAM